MKSCLLRFWVGWASILLPSTAYSQAIQVSLPDTAVAQSVTSITIPIHVSSLTSRNVLFYQAVIVFDKTILRATGGSSVGTLSEPFGQPTVDVSVEGEILIGGSGNTPLSGAGALVNLSFDVLGEPGDMTDLRFAGFIFNTGIPPSNTVSGRFTVLLAMEPGITVSPSSHDFGNVFIGSTLTRAFRIGNVGSVALEVMQTNLSGPDNDQFDIVSGQAPFTVMPGDSQNLVVSFDPVSQGDKSAALQIISNDPNQGALTVPLSGMGVLPSDPDIAVRPVTLDFGEVPIDSAAIQSLTIANQGEGTLIVDSTQLIGADAEQFIIKGSSPPFTVAPADSDVFKISFEPRTVGLKSTRLRIVSNDPDEETVEVLMTGTGVGMVEITPRFILPQNGDIVCGDSILTEVGIVVTGGVSPFEIACTVNEVIGVQEKSMFFAKVPLALGSNPLVATCTITDAVGARDTVSTAIEVFKNPTPVATLKIISPSADTILCDDKVEIISSIRIQGGTPPFKIGCTINDISVDQPDSIFAAIVALAPGNNRIVVSCVVEDSCGLISTSRDTILAFSDPTPPICDLNFDNFPTVTGTLSDFESGIAGFEIIEIRNRTLTIDSFAVGDPVVNFVLEKIDPNLSAGFNFKVSNRAGCFVICDPIDVTLTPANSPCNFDFTIPERERYLYIENHGLDRIQMRINQSEFDLVSSNFQGRIEGNRRLIPLHGDLSFDISGLLVTGLNSISLTCEGPAESFATILITDVLINEEVQLLEANPILPDEFSLAQNYPNPFNPNTQIEFEIAETTPQGTHVQLRIFNLLGELVRVLLDEVKQPGRYRLAWDGFDARGQRVSSGIYLYQLHAGSFRQTRRMILLR
ncbi:MAG: choice-of-anchor D domain-containing protein [bacterium]